MKFLINSKERWDFLTFDFRLSTLQTFDFTDFRLYRLQLFHCFDPGDQLI